MRVNSRKVRCNHRFPGAPFKKLQERRLIKSHEGVYTISEPILKAWLVKKHKDKGVFPFRST